MGELKAAVYLRVGKPVNTAFYCRVASKDADAIELQEMMLIAFAKENDYGSMTRFGEIGDNFFYRDNGESGLTYDRPEMKRLMADIRSSKINTVITKDISRIIRDYLRLHEWLDLLQKHDVRFITMIDGVFDTKKFCLFDKDLSELLKKIKKNI